MPNLALCLMLNNFTEKKLRRQRLLKQETFEMIFTTVLSVNLTEHGPG
jgi:hypothetical protein